jgi:tRNA dimethylallyltransferase
MQVYRELSILTARPGAVEEARAPHRLYGLLSAADACSAGRWRALAVAEIEAAWAARRLPIVVGGTGLYLKVLRHGLAPIPPVPDDVQARARARLEELGAGDFQQELAGRDAAAAARIDAADTQRLLRAWAVVEATGKTLSAWQALPPPADTVTRAAHLPILLMPSRDLLYPACDARFLDMLERGALAEVAALMALGLDPALPAMKAVGVAELRGHLDGALDLATATANAQRATRRYAKRQLTWFRHQMGEVEPYFTQYSESLEHKILSFIRRFLLTQSE